MDPKRPWTLCLNHFLVLMLYFVVVEVALSSSNLTNRLTLPSQSPKPSWPSFFGGLLSTWRGNPRGIFLSVTALARDQKCVKVNPQITSWIDSTLQSGKTACFVMTRSRPWVATARSVTNRLLKQFCKLQLLHRPAFAVLSILATLKGPRVPSTSKNKQ